MADEKKNNDPAGVNLQTVFGGTPLAVLLENIAASFWTTDKHLVVTSAVGHVRTDAAYNPSALAGACLRDILPLPQVIEAHEKALSGETVSYYYGVQGRRFRSSVRPLVDRDGFCCGVIGVSLDVTDEHAAQMMFEKRDAGFSDLLKYIPYGMLIVNKQGRLVYANDTMGTLYGAPVSEVIGEPFTHFLPSRTMPGMREMFRQRIQGKIGAGSYRAALLNKNGKSIPVQIHAALMQYEGEPADLLFVQDISQQVVAESAIQTLVTGMAGRVGQDFFEHVVRSIGDWLGADTVAIGRIEGEYVKAMAMVHAGRPVESFFFTYKDSPCRVALERGFCLFPEGVQELFPKAGHLRTFGAESFIGIAICNDLTGEPIGLMCVSSGTRLQLPPQLEQVFGIIAAKASAEMLRQHAMAALAASEERFRQLFTNAPVSLWVEDFSRVKVFLDGVCGNGTSGLRQYFRDHPEELRTCAGLVEVVDVNTYTLQLFGARNREQLLTGIGQTFTDDSLDTFVEELAVLYDRQRFIAADTVSRTLDGRIIHVRLNASLAPGHEDDWQRVLVSLDDITASKSLERALRQSDEQLRQVSDNLQDVLWLYDLNKSGFVFISKAYASIWGRPPDSLLASPDTWLDAIHPDDRERTTAAFRDEQRGTAATTEYRIIRPDGAIRWISGRTFPIVDADGKTYRMVGIAKDITARKQNEDELIRYRGELEKLVVMRTRELSRREQALEAVYDIATSPFSSFKDVCNETVRTLSYLIGVPYVRVQRVEAGTFVTLAAASADTDPLHTVKHAACGPCKVVCDRGALLQLHGNLHTDYQGSMCLEDGGFKSYVGVPIPDSNGGVVAIISAMDPEERTFQEDDIHLMEIFARYLGHIMENRRLEERVRKNRENELYTKLTSGVAHEVRNPLNAILAITEVLSMEPGDTEEFKEYIGHIRNQVDRLSVLMRDLLDLGKPLQLNNVRPVPVADLCRSGISLWQGSTSFKRHRVELDAPADGNPVVNVDDTRIHQIFINLLENAAQHSPAGSVIRVSAGRQGEQVFMDIRDAGRGVDADKLEKIFDPFFTTRKGGSGLGMSIVRHFITLHDGTVTMRNNDPEPGSTVRILLPVHKGDL